VKRGKEAIDRWRKAHPSDRLDLSGADLHQADLRQANLSGAYLTFAYLVEANLAFANLGGADLRMAFIGGTRLHHTALGQAQFALAYFAFTPIADCDLSVALGLDQVIHSAPSTIGVDTLERSFRGAGNQFTSKLKTFFLAAGVPSQLLDSLPQILAEVQYASAFVCYGEPDKAFAERLKNDLVARGVPCQIFSLDATPGEPTWREVSQKRREAEKMIVLCSAPSLIRSGVLKEIEEQIDEDPDKMMPVSLDNLWKAPGFQVRRGNRDLKPFLLVRNYADFWNRSRPKQFSEMLLKALARQDR
jgi:hypothetical protein